MPGSATIERFVYERTVLEMLQVYDNDVRGCVLRLVRLANTSHDFPPVHILAMIIEVRSNLLPPELPCSAWHSSLYPERLCRLKAQQHHSSTA